MSPFFPAAQHIEDGEQIEVGAVIRDHQDGRVARNTGEPLEATDAQAPHQEWNQERLDERHMPDAREPDQRRAMERGGESHRETLPA